MAHEQGNTPGQDPSKFGLKFDAGKTRWELLPMRELHHIVNSVNFFIPYGIDTDALTDVNIMDFKREVLINEIYDRILSWNGGHKFVFAPTTGENMSTKKFRTLGICAFEVLFLLRGKSYTVDEISKVNSVRRWDLIDMDDIDAVVNVYTMGAKKYADNNWQRVAKGRYFNALMHHLNTVRTVHRYDSELGCLHMHQVVWNLMALLWIELEEERVENAKAIPEKVMAGARKIKNVSLNVKTKKTSTRKSKPPQKKAAKKKNR